MSATLGIADFNQTLFFALRTLPRVVILHHLVLSTKTVLFATKTDFVVMFENSDGTSE